MGGQSTVQISAENQVRVGRELRVERERRGMTLEQVARATRFSVRHLQSLEADLYDELPGGVLRKGIVRSYCRHLELDEDLWLDRFAEGGGLDEAEPDLSQFAENVRRARLDGMAPVRKRWWGVLLMAIVLIALAWSIWHFVVRSRVGLHRGNAVPQESSLRTPRSWIRSGKPTHAARFATAAGEPLQAPTAFPG